MSSPVTDTNPPRGHFGVWQRVLRGYGPLAVFAVLILLLALLIPSKVHDTEPVSSEDGSESTDSGSAGSGAGGFVGQGDGEDGSAGGAGGNGGAGTTGGTTGGGTGGTPNAPRPGCPDRELQVPNDPYSPPCVTFSGGNGGGTSKGVTGDTIKVAFRVLNERGFQQTLADLAGATLVDSPSTITRTVEALADYFSSRFEFYGRSIQIEFYDGQGSNTNELLGKGRDKAEADAIRVAEEIGAFADLSATSEPYAGALAARDVIGFGTPYLSRAWHEQRAPYAWSLATDGSLVSELAAEYAVQRLFDKPAVYAGGNGGDGQALKDRPRSIATLAPENSWYQESVENNHTIIEAAGKEVDFNRKYVLDLATMSNQATGIIAQLRDRNITTVLCGCDPILPVFLSGVAARENYFPEFIIVGTALTDADIVGQLWNQEFASHAFGVSSLTAFEPPTNTIAYQAYKQVRSDEPAFSVDLIYYQMYMLAIGVQGAGPNLTPATFEQGMFSYPEKLGPIGLWKFGTGDRTAANDVREIYWDPNATSTYNSKPGTYLGTSDARWQSGEIPAGNPGKPLP